MSSSVSVSIATNTAIAAAKGFGWFVTASPTLFAETVHSLADVANQILLKIGEVRARGGPDAAHPFGRGQEKFFWALVSAVSVFFVGCGVNVYHGLAALLNPGAIEPFTPLVMGLLLFALVLESYTFVIAFRELAVGTELPRTGPIRPFSPFCWRMLSPCSVSCSRCWSPEFHSFSARVRRSTRRSRSPSAYCWA